MIYGISIVMALLTGVAIGLLLMVARYQKVAEQRQRYEQEAALDRDLHEAAAQAMLQRHRPTQPGK